MTLKLKGTYKISEKSEKQLKIFKTVQISDIL